MKIHRLTSSLKLPKSSALTIGNFDGVHRGHRKLIDLTKRHASRSGGAVTVLTFDPHPQKALRGVAPEMLTTFERRAELMEELGVEFLVVIDFNKSFSEMEPEQFAEQVLAKALKAAAVVVGSNFKFGRFARGDLTMLRQLGGQLGFTVQSASLVKLRGRTVSSTEIRHALRAGDVDWASKALGRPHEISGMVVKGAGRGASMGFPTANIEVVPGMCIPAGGVYAGRGLIGERWLPAAISIGTNPTFGEGPLTVEAHLPGFSGDLYGANLTIEFLKRLRSQQRFARTADLERAMADDVSQTLRLSG